MKRNFSLLLLFLLLVSCNVPQGKKEKVTVVEQEKIIMEEKNKTEKFSVSFSVGSAVEQQNKTQSELAISQNENLSKSITVPGKYESVDSFILTIKDSNGNIVINRKRIKIISWAPGYIVSEALELEAGSYTLEELILLDDDEYNLDQPSYVLYATPREGSKLASCVKDALPMPFDIADQGITVNAQVIDVKQLPEFEDDPAGYFGYDLVSFDEVKLVYVNFKIADLNLEYASGSLIISNGYFQRAQTIEASGTDVLIPELPGEYTLEAAAPDGSRSYELIPYTDFEDNDFNFVLQLYSEVEPKFLIKDENGNDIDANASCKIKYYNNNHYLHNRTYSFQKENDIYTTGKIKATNSNTFTFSMSGYATVTRSYTVDELKESENNPITISVYPLAQPRFIINDENGSFINDVKIYCTMSYDVVDKNFVFDYNTNTNCYYITVTISISNDNLFYIDQPGYEYFSQTYTVDELKESENNPIVIQLKNDPIPAAAVSENFETSSWEFWNDDFPNQDITWLRYSGSTPTSYTGPSSAYEGNYYIYTESSTSISGLTAALVSLFLDFDAQTGEYLHMMTHMYGSNMGKIEVFYQKKDTGDWIFLGSRSGNRGNSWQAFELSLNNIIGRARIMIKATTGDGYESDIAIDDLWISN